MAEGHRRAYALVAEFDRPGRLLAATQAVREAGYSQVETYSPFPVEGVPEALAFKDNAVPIATLIGGLLGAAAGYGVQAYANLDFPLNVGGRPLLAWPAFMLITFETLVLGAVVAGVVTMLIRNRLPKLHHPMFDLDAFALASSDSFFLAVGADDPRFERRALRRLLRRERPTHVYDLIQPEGR
jgi:hypothetical protein